MKTNTDIKHILKQMRSFTQDLTCVIYPLLSETMHQLQVQPGRGGRREACKFIILASLHFLTHFSFLHNIPETLP